MILLLAIVTITLALVFYSAGVWAEKIKGYLKVWHLLLFWAGLTFDTTGTILMSAITEQSTFDIHSLSGILSILLMALHAMWATIVLIRKQEQMMYTFHKFSIVVWLIWLVPYMTGVVLNV